MTPSARTASAAGKKRSCRVLGRVPSQHQRRRFAGPRSVGEIQRPRFQEPIDAQAEARSRDAKNFRYRFAALSATDHIARARSRARGDSLALINVCNSRRCSGARSNGLEPRIGDPLRWRRTPRSPHQSCGWEIGGSLWRFIAELVSTIAPPSGVGHIEFIGPPRRR